MNSNREWVYKKCPRSLIEAISFHTLLLNLGFSIKTEVFISFTDKSVIIILRTQGKEASFRIGSMEYDSQTMLRLWKQLISQWNTGGSLSDSDKNEIYLKSKSIQLLPIVIAGLVREGFQIDPVKAHKERQRLLTQN